jgi:hypothetical protein
MKKIILFLSVFLLTTLIVFSQRTNFVYLQTEPAQPFQVKMNGMSYTSSQSGYLILSKLVDTSYHIEVSFPSNKWPSQFFNLVVNQMDRGYLLKDFGDKGWGLMDWRSLAVQYSKLPVETKTVPVTAIEDSTDFATLLSLASGDPSLRAKTEVKIDSVQKPIVIAAASSSSVNDIIVSNPVLPNKKADTLTGLPTDETFLSTEVITNARCKEMANQLVLDSLSQAMQLASTDTKRLLTASQFFQSSCFSVSQLKQLCNYFKTDEGRYDFLLEAWLYVTDRTQFDKLVVVFSNQDLVQRFKAMIQ